VLSRCYSDRVRFYHVCTQLVLQEVLNSAELIVVVLINAGNSFRVLKYELFQVLSRYQDQLDFRFLFVGWDYYVMTFRTFQIM